VAISCGNVAFCTAVPGDSHGLRPRNDMLVGSWSYTMRHCSTGNVGNAVPGVPSGAMRKHRARKCYRTDAVYPREPATNHHRHCEEPSGDVAISCGNVAVRTAVPGDSHGLRPRNDMLVGSRSCFMKRKPTRGVPSGAVRKHRARISCRTATAHLWNHPPTTSVIARSRQATWQSPAGMLLFALRCREIPRR